MLDATEEKAVESVEPTTTEDEDAGIIGGNASDCDRPPPQCLASDATGSSGSLIVLMFESWFFESMAASMAAAASSTAHCAGVSVPYELTGVCTCCPSSALLGFA